MVTATQAAGRYPYGTTMTLTATPAPGYRFVSWSDGNSQQVRDITLAADVNITATFTQINYNIVITSNDPAKGTVSGLQSVYHYGDVLNLTAQPTSEQYHFDFWSDGDENAVRTLTVTSDLTLIAFFSDASYYTVSAVSNNDAWGSVAGTGRFYLNDVATLTATPAAHHHLRAWSDVEDNSLTRTVTVTRDSIITALFAPDTFSVTLTESTLGTVSGSGRYAYGQEVTVSANATAENYVFVRWENAAGETLSTESSYSFTMAADITLTAVFDIQRYNVLVYNGSEQHGHVTGGGLDIPAGTEVTLIAVPDEHYHFAGWQCNDMNIPGGDTLVFNVQASGYYVALFELDSYNFAYSSSDMNRGYVMSNRMAGSYEYNTPLTVVAVATPHSRFTGWNNGETRDTLTFNLTGDTNLVANFTVETFAIRVVANDDQMGTVTGGGDFEYHDITTISATANEGYHFAGWSDGVTDATRTLYVERDSTLMALFAINRYYVTTRVNNSLMGSISEGGWYNHGDSVHVVATAGDNFDFVGFNGSQDGNMHADFVAMGDTTITAYFKHHYHMIYLSANHGSFEVEVEGETRSTAIMPMLVLNNDSVTISAIADQHYHFDHWNEYEVTVSTSYHDSSYVEMLPRWVWENGNLIEVYDSAVVRHVQVAVVTADTNFTGTYFDQTLAFRINSTRYLNAVFTVNRYMVTLQGEHVSVSGDGIYVYGSNVTVSATPDAGYHFVAWVDQNGDTVSTESSYTFPIEASVTLTAVVEITVGIGEADASPVTVYAAGSDIHVVGAHQRQVRVFDAVGRMVSSSVATTDHYTVSVNGTGIFVVQVNGTPAKRVAVVK